ncbi:heme-binding protein [Mycobacterium sp. 1081908.1]|uniref:GlcG/HbpS family heme-binding protein n=1 Tax=Mycobacterium sp. 1081908.1 TaxID=1834066 RepID=UPI0007FD71F8|nr:heme-binding protein [Mycobacterium sp. 1081908.1]OBK45778.1 hypothetical protein A5655_10990 [Mycobacterium sp. 1081908.1]
MNFSLATATTIAQETLLHGQRSGAAPLAVAVLDGGGHPIALMRSDGAGFLRTDIATAKAWGALGMGEPSAQLAIRAQKNPEFFTSLAQVSGGRIALAAGGVLCQGVNGEILGAVGVSGDTADADERCAIAGIQAAGLTAIGGPR